MLEASRSKTTLELKAMNNANITSAFQQIFSAVVCFTLLGGSGSVWYSTKDSLSPQQVRVFETCNTTWNLGIGAIFGMVGGKTTDRPPSNEEEEEN